MGLVFLVQRRLLLVRHLILLVQQPPHLVQQPPLRMQHFLPAQHPLLVQHLPPLPLFVRHLALFVQQPLHRNSSLSTCSTSSPRSTSHHFRCSCGTSPNSSSTPPHPVQQLPLLAQHLLPTQHLLLAQQ